MADTDELHALSVTEALCRIEAGAITSQAWLASCMERIEAREPQVRAWVSLDRSVVADAAAREAGGQGPCIPVGVKDIIDVRGLPTRMGTAFHDPAPPTREGGSVSLLREAGCVFVGKTVTTELGHRHPGPTRNPHRLTHTPGGSSSGSAAAVADLMVPVALGTQTSGSVIRPAAYCGVVGYKPTYHDFDRTGILANAPSMDTLGVLARAVDDIALVRAMLLRRPRASWRKVVSKDVETRGLRFALLDAALLEGADEDSRAQLEDFMRGLGRLGMTRVDVSLQPAVERLLSLHRLICGYEFSRSIAFERVHHLSELSPVLREGRLADGHLVAHGDYLGALEEVAGIRRVLAGKFADVDVIVSPSAQGPAPAGLGFTGDATFNSAWTLAGNPCITLPLFRAADSGLPIGCQLIAASGDDERLLAVARRLAGA